jgi:predicted DNA-binding transcriptional regulator YafY
MDIFIIILIIIIALLFLGSKRKSSNRYRYSKNNRFKNHSYSKNEKSLSDFKLFIEKSLSLPLESIPPNHLEIYYILKASLTSDNTVNLHYRKECGEESYRDVKPIAFGKFQNKIYLVGYCYLRNDERTFLFDRILKVKPNIKS